MFQLAVYASASQASPPDRAGLERSLDSLAQASDSRAATISRLLDLAVQTTGALAAAYFGRDHADRLTLENHSLAPQCNQADAWLFDQLLAGAERACREERSQLGRVEGNLVTVACQVAIPGAAAESLAIALVGDADARDAVAALEQIARGMSMWSAREAGRQDRWLAECSAASLELVEKLLAAGNLERGCLAVAGALAEHLGCQRVAIGLARRDGRSCKLAAISGMADVDPRAEFSVAVEAVMNDTLARGEAIHTHERLSQLSGGGKILSAPLRTPAGDLVGAWTFIGGESLNSERTMRFVESSAPFVATGLRTLQSAGGLNWFKTLPSLPKAWTSRRKIASAAAVAALVLLLLPLPYKVGCDCEMQPTTRRFIAAPYEGIFEKSLVKPGDLVRRDQVLGNMDGRIVRWDFAGLTADQQRAGKSRDVNLATGKVAAAQIDRLEMERLELKRQLLADREQKLEIKSPLDGIVISGDLERSEGVAVKLGQPLFEVAPLDRMIAELAIPDEEIAHIEPGQTVTIELDAFPGRPWTGELVRVHPRSEIRETDNVFIGEVLLDNAHAELRPGMKGRAKIAGERHTLGWILLHKPWQTLMRWLGC